MADAEPGQKLIEFCTIELVPLVCNICNHPITKLGNEWTCEQRCRCLMMGCTPTGGAGINRATVN